MGDLSKGLEGHLARQRGVGRPKGVKNKRTVQVEKWLRPLLPGAKRKLKALVSSDDDSVALKASLAVVAYIYGKPTQRQELTGADGSPVLERIERVIVEEPSRVIAAPAGRESVNRQPAAVLLNGEGYPREQEAPAGPVATPTKSKPKIFTVPAWTCHE